MQLNLRDSVNKWIFFIEGPLNKKQSFLNERWRFKQFYLSFCNENPKESFCSLQSLALFFSVISVSHAQINLLSLYSCIIIGPLYTNWVLKGAVGQGQILGSSFFWTLASYGWLTWLYGVWLDSPVCALVRVHRRVQNNLAPCDTEIDLEFPVNALCTV